MIDSLTQKARPRIHERVPAGTWHNFFPMSSTLHRVWVIALAICVFSAPARGQNPGSQATQEDDGTVRLRLPTVIVTAEKEPANIQDAPVSVTAVTADTIQQAGVESVSEAAQYAPNTFFNEFTARKLSNARFRGIGSSPNNPAVTTFIDGVPQLNANSSSIEMLGVEQIEFVRGPQSALFGRNTLGGLVNITSTRPSRNELDRLVHRALRQLQQRATCRARRRARSANVSPSAWAPATPGAAATRSTTITGNDLDSRSATFSKTQILWAPTSAWDVRGIFTTERARDGDYALNDLGALRAAPLHGGPRLRGPHEPRHRGADPAGDPRRRDGRFLVHDRLRLVEDRRPHRSRLHAAAAPAPLATPRTTASSRRNSASPRRRTPREPLSRGVTLRWQAGLFLFSQNYTQDAVNTFSPFVLSQFLPLRRSSSIRPRRRSTTPASASTATRRSRSTAGSTRPSGCAPITRTRTRT